MPLHESPKDFLERVKVYMKTLQNVNGLLLLVDMDHSLTLVIY